MTDSKVFLVGVGGLLAGAAAGYFLAEHRLRKEYADLADEEIELMREHFGRTREPKEEFNHPEQDIHEAQLRETKIVTVDKASDLVDKSDYETTVYNRYFQENDEPTEGEKDKVDDEVEEGPPVKPNPNVMLDDFKLSDHDKRARKANMPYVIHSEEYSNEETGYSQSTITYFPDDDILLDENDDILEEIEMYVGTHNLTRFGERSGDPNIVYIRNPRFEHEYEVVLEPVQAYEEYLHRSANYKRG